MLVFYVIDVKATNPDFEKFLAPFQDSLSNATTIEDSLRLYFKICRFGISKSASKSIEYGDIALKIATDLGDEKFVKKIKHRMSIPLMTLDSFTRAESHLKEAIQYYRKHKMEPELAMVMTHYGWYFIRLDKYITAIDTLNYALDIRKKLKDERGIRDIYNRIGISYTRMGEDEKANEYYVAIVEEALKGDNKSFLTAASFNAANHFYHLADYENSKKYYEITMQQRSKKGIDNMENKSKGYYYLSKARIEKMDANVDQAIQMVDTAVYYFRLSGSFGDIQWSLFDKIEFLNEAGNYSQALQTLKEVEQTKSFKKFSYFLNATKLKAQTFEGLNQTDSAYYYYKQHVVIKDSMDQENFDKQLIDYQAKINKDRNIREQEILKLRNARFKANFFIALGFLSLIALLAYRHSKRMQKSNKLLTEKNEIIETSLLEKEMLLKEVHHRVKNNLQIVSSILNLQARHIQEEKALNAIKDSRNRVKSMALIHQNLYKKDNLNSILISTYIHNLCQSLFYSYKVNEEKIKLVTEIDPLRLDVDTGVPIGLIINELVTNSVKYAFPNNQSGELFIGLIEEANYLKLVVKDNGIGLENNIDLKNAKTFGYSLIESLSHKLKASMETNSSNGMCTILKIHKFTKI